MLGETSWNFFERNHVPPLSITSASRRPPIFKIFYSEKEKKERKWHLPRIQFIFRPFKDGKKKEIHYYPSRWILK